MAPSRLRSGTKANSPGAGDGRGRPHRRRNPEATAGHGLARVLSKRGVCSRSEAERLVRDGRVSVDGQPCFDPERRTALDSVDIRIDGQLIAARPFVYLMLNKPRGLVTTRSDERGRATVYDCLHDSGLPWLAPVGRLDQASEGLLLFSNDSAWAARIAAPEAHLPKTYHVQIDCVPDDTLLAALRGDVLDRGECLRAQRVDVLRAGRKSGWLDIVLVQGRNRQIRRMLAAQGVQVRRLVRIAIGPLRLGTLAKGAWRMLTLDEAHALAVPGQAEQQR